MLNCQNTEFFISIHSARVGGDSIVSISTAITSISIHSARVGGDGAQKIPANDDVKFQSTPPVWAET